MAVQADHATAQSPEWQAGWRAGVAAREGGIDHVAPEHGGFEEEARGQMKRDRTPFEMVNERLERAALQLEKQAAILEDRLGAVLLPIPTEGMPRMRDDERPMAGGSARTETLTRITDQLEGVLSRLQRLEGALDL
jgi:hypothetical protein